VSSSHTTPQREPDQASAGDDVSPAPETWSGVLAPAPEASSVTKYRARVSSALSSAYSTASSESFQPSAGGPATCGRTPERTTWSSVAGVVPGSSSTNRSSIMSHSPPVQG
jgi:hypothetical protein